MMVFYTVAAFFSGMMLDKWGTEPIYAAAAGFGCLGFMLTARVDTHMATSSGTNVGAGTIDYQKPFQAAGLDPAIPWYAVLGNHDHFWMGGLLTPPQPDFTNENVLFFLGNYMGTIDSSTPYGDVIDVGSVTNFHPSCRGAINTGKGCAVKIGIMLWASLSTD